MTRGTRPPAVAGAAGRRAAAMAGLAAVAIAIAGCAADASPSPTAVATSGLASPIVGAPSPSAGAGASAASSVSTTVTDWGVIRDEVPADFPLPPGTKPADLPGGPYSGAYTSTSSAPEALVVVQQGLKAAGYPDATQSVATESGEVTIDATGAGGCRIQVAIAPLGGLTSITVLYGASCP